MGRLLHTFQCISRIIPGIKAPAEPGMKCRPSRQENEISEAILSLILKILALPEGDYHAVEGRNKAKEQILNRRSDSSRKSIGMIMKRQKESLILSVYILESDPFQLMIKLRYDEGLQSQPQRKSIKNVRTLAYEYKVPFPMYRSPTPALVPA